MAIDIHALTEADKGREVRYENRDTVEFGRITSWNQPVVFVRYHTKIVGNGPTLSRMGDTSEATSPEDLELTK